MTNPHNPSSPLLSFGRCIESLMEYVALTRCTFSSVGAKRLLEDLRTLIEWAKAFDEKHKTTCCLSPALDRAHAIMVVLVEPSVSTRTPELMLCIEQLPDLENWLHLRSDRGELKTWSGASASLAASARSTTLSVSGMSGGSEKSKGTVKRSRVQLSTRIMTLVSEITADMDI